MNKYVFKPYNPLFPELFENEKIKLKNILEKDVVIEHIGSTAIPGLDGKGIIDILVGISGDETFTDIIAKLEKLGYEHRKQADTPERIFLRVDLPDEIETVRRYHIHVTHLASKDWNETLKFRDYLKDNPNIVRKYEALKLHAIKESKNDGKVYRKLKQPFIEKYSH